MKFEWDEAKNTLNIKKHKLDFADVPEIFKLPLLTRLDTRHDYGEDRWIGIGTLNARVVVVVFTEVEDVIRIISLRKAVKNERTKYKKSLKNRLG